MKPLLHLTRWSRWRRAARCPESPAPRRLISNKSDSSTITKLHPLLSLVYRREYEEARRLAITWRHSTRADFHALLILYRDTSDITSAEETIRRMKASEIPPTLTEYHILITLYAYCGFDDKARLLMRDIAAQGISIPVDTVLQLLDIFSDQIAPPKAVAVFVEARQLSIQPLRPLWTKLLTVCARANDMDLLGTLIQDMMADNIVPEGSWFEELCTLWNDQERYPQLKSIWMLLSQQPNADQLPSKFWHQIVQVARRFKDYPLLLDLHDRMSDLGMEIGPPHYASLIHFHAAFSKDLDKLWRIWNDFRDRYRVFALSGSECGSILKAFVEEALERGVYDTSSETQLLIDHGIQIFEFESINSALFDHFSMHEWAAILYALRGRSDQATLLVEEQANANAHGRYFSIGCLGVAIGALKEKRWHDVISVFHRYILPNRVRYGTALFSILCHACARIGAAGSALSMLDYTLQYTDHQPRSDAYMSIFLACAQEGLLSEIVDIIRQVVSNPPYARYITEYMIHAIAEILKWYNIATPRVLRSTWTIPLSSSSWQTAISEADKLSQSLDPLQRSWVLNVAVPAWRSQIITHSALSEFHELKSQVRSRLSAAGLQNSEMIRRSNTFRRKELEETLLELAGTSELRSA